MNKEQLKNLYPLIAKGHPRTDLTPVHEIKLYVIQESLKKRELTAREIWIEIKKYPKRVIDNSIKWLYESGYIKRIRRGSGFFFTEEKKDDSFGESYHTRQDIEEIKKKRAKEVLTSIKEKSIILDKNLNNEYQNLLKSFKKGNPNLNSYNKIIDFLWKKGFLDFVKLSFKSGAYRYKK